ncbi:MAG: hypothetical protein ACFE9S_19455 [Candidatus Hermodarchaeota archaeon]
MIENNESPSNYCRYCGWKFNRDIIQRIKENRQTVVCEICGIELNNSSITLSERLRNEKNIGLIKSIINNRKKFYSIVNNIKKCVTPEKYSVSIISRDDDFPKIFKENLIIVISRLIYYFIKEWEQENEVSVRRVSLEKSILIYLIRKIKPILYKRVNENYLNNLFKITVKDFEKWLRLLQQKVELDQVYQTYFKYFLTWLIKVVFKLVSDMWEMKNLPKLQATILKDLKKYDFDLIKRVQTTSNLEIESESEVDKTPSVDLHDTLKFLEVFRREVEKIVPSSFLTRRQFGAPSTLSIATLSRLIYGVDYRIQKKIVKRVRKNPSYIIALDDLNHWITRLRVGFDIYLIGSPDHAINLVKNYIDLHKNEIIISRNPDMQLYLHHPNINENYFSLIETIEKAYWLGFFFGDGWIVKRDNNSDRIIIGIKLSASPRYLKYNYYHLIRWCSRIGLDPSYINTKYEIVKKYGAPRLRLSISIKFSSKKMANDLFNWGFLGGKKTGTRWPLLEWSVDNNLKPLFDLIFIYGLYDAEGHTGQARIKLRSKEILDVIKDRFNIPFEVKLYKDGDYFLSLTPQLLNLMQAIYPNGLGYKKKTFFVHKYKELIFNSVMTPELLKALLRILSIDKISTIFKVDQERIGYLIDFWDIEMQ